MAERGTPSSESDSESSKFKKPSNPFSIDSLLSKSKPQPIPHWELVRQQQPTFGDYAYKQVCPVPPNIVVPRNLFERVSLRATPKPGTSASVSKVPLDEVGSSIYLDCETTEQDVTTSNDDDVSNCLDEEGVRFKKKRPRTAFSVPQIRTLEAEFERNRYLTGSKRKELSRELKLSETQIKIWFQNRRTKLKRKNVSEMETWVQQLYSPLGPLAPRPLVIGDHLYLFNTSLPADTPSSCPHAGLRHEQNWPRTSWS